jgi:hypothetical protein
MVETGSDYPESIGTLQENSLHADLKRWVAQPGDCLEERVDGFLVDIVRDGTLIEIQTRNFYSIKRKLHKLLDKHSLRLIYPIASVKWIVRMDAEGETIVSRRKSPRRGRLEHLFNELIRIPELINHPNFTLEVLLIQEEEVQREDGQGSWRRKGRSIMDRRLLEVVSQKVFSDQDDFLTLLPNGLPALFTTRDLARALGQPRYVAQKMVYCLSRMGAIRHIGNRDRSHLYSIERNSKTL